MKKTFASVVGMIVVSGAAYYYMAKYYQPDTLPTQCQMISQQTYLIGGDKIALRMKTLFIHKPRSQDVELFISGDAVGVRGIERLARQITYTYTPAGDNVYRFIMEKTDKQAYDTLADNLSERFFGIKDATNLVSIKKANGNSHLFKLLDTPMGICVDIKSER
ncbi:hypothetical protein [Serratia liquefaciens]|uniref:hypothetical protein n=1 Tax=Serratia liquefaciens TaxID=614 RepID=UPI0021576891|nr:hypothetical protein [Serratia liquefaciens]